MSSRALVSISGSALSKNYRIISEKVPQLGLIPMVKADAYGHGAGFVGKVLSQERNFYAFGVATFQEAVSLRATLKSRKIPILVFSDSVPWTHEKARLCLSLGLEPVFSEVTSLLKFQSGTDGNRIPAHVEFNTGMNRLGIPIESLSLVRFYPKTVFTHLADADSPDSTLTRLQIKRFSELVPEVRARFPKAKLHFANSAALWNPKRYPLLKQMD
ncbi:hypothetical protein EBZ37_11470, partial [bacterium]|nr:hypothetical protein [bacterium]